MMLMMVAMILAPLLLVGLIVIAVWLASGLFGQGQRFPSQPAEGAGEILAQRYARGEISKDQYDQILAEIAD
jgi:uncharacterized membrane protein